LLGLLVAIVCTHDAHAANELCGQTIATSITLTADQSCADDGLIVGADGITIDLAGFTISGDGDPDHVGIEVGNHSHVTIQNGTVRNFNIGIRGGSGMGTEAVKLSNVTARENVKLGAGLSVCFGTVTHSLFIDNNPGGLTDGAGLLFLSFCAKPSMITASAFVGNRGAAGLNFAAFAPGSKSKISGVTATGNHTIGLRLSGADFSVGSSTVAANSLDGVQVVLDSEAITIAKNVIVGNLLDGIRFFLSGADRPNVVATNLIAGNRGSGVHLANLNPTADVVVTGNRLIGNGADGVKIESPSASVVRGNTALGNDDSGFTTTNATTTFAKNAAVANHAAGIFAAAAIDGGGNRARANAGTQCSAAIACPPAFTPKAGPTIPSCGTHVNSSIKLGADPPFCTGTSGLIVDADGVTIDLNGHRYHGDRSGGTIGIDVGSHKNVTIKNGIIQGFATGISTALLSNGLKIVNVEVRDSVDLGVSVAAIGAKIDKTVVVSNSGPGLVLGDFASATKVSSSFFVANTGDGLTSKAPGGNLSNVTSAGNVGIGIRLTGSGNGKLQGGTVAANGNAGILIDGAFATLAPSIVKKTLIAGNENDGINLQANSTAMTFDSNFSGGNGNNGILLTNEPQATIVKRNVCVGNAGSGVLLDPDVTATSIVKNAAIGNVGAGFEIFPFSTLAKNTAVGNAGFGISTPGGATDGGGNTAHDNGGAPQCSSPLVCD
jgi:hypothetical protein